MAKIFQLEFFIKEMNLWTLPLGSEEHDETCVEVTVFDNQNVPINGYVFGKNSTMNQGQNFLFTLSALPIDDNKVFFNVFKKAYNREKNFLGKGNIPIDTIFGELFSQVLKKAKTDSKMNALAMDQKQNQDSAIVSSKQNPPDAKNDPSKTTANAKTASNNNQPLKPNPSQTKANANLTSKKDQKDANRNQTQNQATAAIQNPSQTKANANATSKVANQKNDNTIVGSTNDPQAANQNVAIVGNKNDPQAPQADIPAIKNLKSVDIASTTAGSPISRLSKDVYPIIGCDSKQWGTICILMRLTCFGYHSAQPIVIHQNHKEIILQSTPKSATYKCVPLQLSKHRNDRRETYSTGISGSKLTTSSSSTSSSTTSSSSNATTNVLNSNVSKIRKTKNFSNYCTDMAKSNIASSGSSNNSSNATISRANAYSDPCPGPPGSPSGQYEEFTAEINGNVLCVRVPKNVGSVKRIYDKQDSFKKGGSRSGVNDYSDRRKIPIIRGNRKYPAHYGTVSSLPSSRNSTVFDQQKRGTDYSIENRNRHDDNISCPSNVQITRRNNDPNRDVFLLDIGNDGRSGKGIQLEMKTPKNPMARSITNKQTTSVQTYDDEFVSGSKKGGGGAKKGRKKGKK